jgi:hypothetical protein
MSEIARCAWSEKCSPVVFAHLPWQSDSVPSLASQTGYFSAKLKRDASAALSVVKSIAGTSPVTDDLLGYVVGRGEDRVPIVVAPALAPGENQNALSIGYAKWLAADLEWEFQNSIFKARSAKRDFETDPWYRIVALPQFFGYVEPGRSYVIVDDLYHMGGTLASLRGFIESKGGHVIAVSALGFGGFGTRFALAEDAKIRLMAREKFDETLKDEIGYGIECLTAPEGEVVLRCSSVDELRDGLRNGRDICAMRGV